MGTHFPLNSHSNGSDPLDSVLVVYVDLRSACVEIIDVKNLDRMKKADIFDH